MKQKKTRGIPKGWKYKTAQFITFIILKILYRISYEGFENIPMEGGVIIAPNHASFIDPPAVGAKIPRELCYLAKKELFPIPLIRQFLQISHSIPIDRGGYTKSTLKELVKRLKEGWAFSIFPEGTRTRTGKFGSPKKGIGMIAVMADVPIVPCWIEGSYRAKPFVSKITLHFLPPFKPSEIKAETKKDHYLLVSERIMYDIIKFCNTHNGRAQSGQI